MATTTASGPIPAPPMICEICGAAVESQTRRTCSRSCAARLSWLTNREPRLAAISVAQKKRGGEIAEMNRRRWARPGEREKLSARNRAAWADPEQRERLCAAIRTHHQQPEVRRFYSDMRRAMWRDPEYRARVTEIIGASHRTPEYRAMFSALLQERWKDPVWRAKWTAAMRRRYAKPAPPRKPLELPSLPPPPPPPPAPDRRSAARIAEEEAIAAFMRSKGIQKLPSVGDPALGALPLLVYDRETRKYRRPSAARTGSLPPIDAAQ